MSDFHLVGPRGWEYDLQSVYSAYMGYFQLHNIPWHNRTWGQFFETFEQFLAFSWPVVTVTDTRTGRAHIVTRMTSINAFLKMIETRFGETLPQVDNMFLVKPIETAQRHLQHVNDWSTYKKLHSSLPAVALAALKARVRTGDPSAIRELWETRDKTFLAIDFECLERNERSCVEWGYAAIRSSLLVAAGTWPPVPHMNYRKGHYVVSEHADALTPSLSWQYAFGESQVIPKAKLPRIVQSVLSGLVSPDSDTVANDVVVVGHGIQAIIQRLEDLKIKLPNNVLLIDVAYLERALFNTGERGPMVDRKTGRARLPEALLSLSSLLRSVNIEPPCALHNAGNDAFVALVAFQRMVDRMGMVVVPTCTWTGMGMGNAGKDGSGHMRRAVTVAARFFWPLGVAQPAPAKLENGHGHEHGHDGHGNASLVRTMRLGGDEADETGMRASRKRASMFNPLTTSPSTVPADENLKKLAVHGHGNASPVQTVRLGGDGADETGMRASRKRASMFSALTTSPSTVPADESLKKMAVHGHENASLVQTVRLGGDGTDEMGMRASRKRASMFSTLTSSPSTVPADKSLKKTASHASSTGSGRWLSSRSSTILVGQRRQSVLVLGKQQ